MTRHCCAAGPVAHRPARRVSRVVAAVLPAAALILLPKCPLCLAAWLAVATGISFSAAGVEWLRVSLVLLFVASLASVIWRRVCDRKVAPRRT